MRSFGARLGSLYAITGPGKRMSSMEGLRGVAVLLVFFVHYSQLFGTALPNSSWTRSILFSAEQIGHSGVDLFFLLSGYLIYSVLASGKSTLWQFLVRRAQRIYPTFLVVFVIYAAIEFTQPDSKLPSGGTTLYLLKNLLLLPGVFAIRPLITVAWSLSYEIFYYLAIPALYHALRLRRWTPAARLLLFVAAAGGYAALCFLFWPVRIPALALNPFQHVRMIMFAAGIILYELLTAFRAGSRVRPAFDYLATAGVLLAFALILTNSGGSTSRSGMRRLCSSPSAPLPFRASAERDSWQAPFPGRRCVGWAT